MLTLKQLAALLGISLDYVRMIRRRGCPCVRNAQGRLVFDPIAVTAWLEENTNRVITRKGATCPSH